MQLVSLLNKNEWIFSFVYFSIRYYRANSVKFPTQACEGVCSLNHYCAITRIDYREFRQCLETAASALASNTKPIIGDINNNKIFLLTLTILHLFLYQQTSIMDTISTSINVCYAIKYSLFVYCHVFLTTLTTFSFMLLQNLQKLVKLSKQMYFSIYQNVLLKI